MAARSAITVAEVLVSIGVLTLLMSLIAPAIQQSRELSRATTCRNNLHQLMLAMHEHEASYRTFPYTSTRWIETGSPGRDHYSRSPHRELMASLDLSISRRLDSSDITDPGWTSAGPTFVSVKSRELQKIAIPVLACPSDRVPVGATSYRANLGTSIEVLTDLKDKLSPKPHGSFDNGRSVAPAEFLDGLSNTVMFSERAIGDYNPVRYEPFRDLFAIERPALNAQNLARMCRDESTTSPRSEYSFAGGTWQLGGWLNTWYNHVLTPNSVVPDCGEGPCCVDGGRVIVTPRSLHRGGVNAAMGDGRVRFVSNSIDLAVWMSMGTRNGGESLAE